MEGVGKWKKGIEETDERESKYESEREIEGEKEEERMEIE
jgi:hypothetical protein